MLLCSISRKQSLHFISINPDLSNAITGALQSILQRAADAFSLFLIRICCNSKSADYAPEEAFTLEYVSPSVAIGKNRRVEKCPYNPAMFEREARVLELLIHEKVV